MEKSNNRVFGEDVKESYNGAMMDVGKYTEGLFLAYCQSKGLSCVDVRDDAKYQHTKIDFVVAECDDCPQITVDVKSSAKIETDGLVIELARQYVDSYYETTGWFFRSQAKWVNYIDPKSRIMYAANLRKLRARYAEIADDYPGRWFRSDSRKWTKIAYIPLKQLTVGEHYQRVQLP